jgi:uncharacterized repeat protein (TIGR03803 family)
MKMLLYTAVIALTCGLAFGQQYKVLWSFGGPPNDGDYPLADLVFDKAGNLYGTTQGGGNGVSGFGGTVFRLSPSNDGSWTDTILYNFCSNQCLDGSLPQSGLVFDATGNLYGTTYHGGGSVLCGDTTGCGVAFELSPPASPGGAWTEVVLHNFCTDYVNRQCLDGFFPASQLTFDASGSLYGTTTGGGSGRFTGGTVFELSRGAGGWTETVLYNFCSLGQGNFCPDGSAPQAGVTFDKAGNLYGTTEVGGSLHSQGDGTVYKLSPGSTGWIETVLQAGSLLGGAAPLGTASLDPLGNLYATFSSGGQHGSGGVFRLSQKGSGSKDTFSFNGEDGDAPAGGVLVDSRQGVLYGTTSGGFNYFGSVFEIAPPANATVLYNFCSEPNCSDGLSPKAGVIQDQSGNLYGTAELGGTNNLGVVFEIVQSAPKQKASQRPLVGDTVLPPED